MSLWPRRQAHAPRFTGGPRHRWRRAPTLKAWEPPSNGKRAQRMLYLTVAVVLVMSLAGSFTLLKLTGEMRYGVWFFALIVGAVFAGRLIGEYVWTLVGTRYTALMLRLYARFGRRRGGKLMITPYADFVPGRVRQIWEAMGFAAGVSMLTAATILFVTEEDSEALPWISLAGLVLSICLTFMLVPHWTFARLGLRISEPQRFVVRSIAESYAGWIQVSNGTIVLGASFYAINALAGRAARSEIWLLVGVSMALLLTISLVAMGTATAYYKRHEEKVLRRVLEDAKRAGFVAMTGGSPTAV